MMSADKISGKINILIKSRYVWNINKATQLVCKILSQFMVQFSGPVMMPKKGKKRFTLLRGPHINKDSRQVLEIDFCKRLIQVPKSQTAMSAIAALSTIIDKDTLVSIEIKEAKQQGVTL